MVQSGKTMHWELLEAREGEHRWLSRFQTMFPCPQCFCKQLGGWEREYGAATTLPFFLAVLLEREVATHYSDPLPSFSQWVRRASDWCSSISSRRERAAVRCGGLCQFGSHPPHWCLMQWFQITTWENWPWTHGSFNSCCSVLKSHPTLCNPMDHSTSPYMLITLVSRGHNTICRKFSRALSFPFYHHYNRKCKLFFKYSL